MNERKSLEYVRKNNGKDERTDMKLTNIRTHYCKNNT